MVVVRSLGLAILLSATVFHGRAAAAHLAAPLPAGAPQFQLVSGCGLGVRRGPGYDCPRVYPRVHGKRHAYRRGGYRPHRKDHRRGKVARSQPYDGFYRIPHLFGRRCGFGYDISCILDICWRRCW